MEFLGKRIQYTLGGIIWCGKIVDIGTLFNGCFTMVIAYPGNTIKTQVFSAEWLEDHLVD